jgi:hypothetical protein
MPVYSLLAAAMTSQLPISRQHHYLTINHGIARTSVGQCRNRSPTILSRILGVRAPNWIGRAVAKPVVHRRFPAPCESHRRGQNDSARPRHVIVGDETPVTVADVYASERGRPPRAHPITLRSAHCGRPRFGLYLRFSRTRAISRPIRVVWRPRASVILPRWPPRTA